MQKMFLTIRLQQSGDPQLSLSHAEGLLQVLLVGSVSGLGQIHQARPQSMKDSQEDHATSPAGLEVFHTQCAPSSMKRQVWIIS